MWDGFETVLLENYYIGDHAHVSSDFTLQGRSDCGPDCRGIVAFSPRHLLKLQEAQLSSSSTSGSSSTVNNNFNQSGVIIDAAGVLSKKTFTDPSGQLTRERIAEAKTTLDPKVTAYSKLRKISLNRLEAVAGQHQGVLSEEMRCLAGLQRIRYVFYYPETKDIVIAGPAEGWFTNVAGHVVGINTGRPVVQLQDLVVGLRAFPPNGKANLVYRLLDRSHTRGPGRHAAIS